MINLFLFFFFDKIFGSHYMREIGKDHTVNTLSKRGRKGVGLKRAKQFSRELRKYGFTSADTWNLDQTMVALLYERACLFRDKAFDIIDGSDSGHHRVELFGKEYNLEDAVDVLISAAKEALVDESFYVGGDVSKVDRVWQIWTELSPYMWW